MRLVLLVLAVSMAYGSECLHYQDCKDSSCFGAARSCEDGRCIYSECIVKSEGRMPSISEIFAPYGGSFDGAFGMKEFLIIGFKILLLGMIGLILIALFSMSEPTGLKKLAVICVILAVELSLALLLFKGPAMAYFLPSEKNTWESSSPVSFIPDYMAARDAQTRGLPADAAKQLGAREGIEVKASDFDEEIRLVILGTEKPESIPAVRLQERYHLPEAIETLSGEKVLVYSRKSYDTLVWDEDRFIFILTARNESSRIIARQLIALYPGKPSASRLFPNDIIPPVIDGITPANGSIVKSKVGFKVHDKESGIGTIIVLPALGFRQDEHCRTEGKALSCEYAPEWTAQGLNGLTLTATDTEGNSRETALNYIYDTERPLIESQTARFISSPSIVFRVFDEQTGIDEYSIEALGMNASSKSIVAAENGFIARFLDNSMPEGKHDITVKAYDLAGNSVMDKISFILDSTRPAITLMEEGFVITDDYGIDISSVRVNRRFYDTEGCISSEKNLVCQNGPVTEVEAADLAGNRNSVLGRLLR